MFTGMKLTAALVLGLGLSLPAMADYRGGDAAASRGGWRQNAEASQQPREVREDFRQDATPPSRSFDQPDRSQNEPRERDARDSNDSHYYARGGTHVGLSGSFSDGGTRVGVGVSTGGRSGVSVGVGFSSGGYYGRGYYGGSHAYYGGGYYGRGYYGGGYVVAPEYCAPAPVVYGPPACYSAPVYYAPPVYYSRPAYYSYPSLRIGLFLPHIGFSFHGRF